LLSRWRIIEPKREVSEVTVLDKVYVIMWFNDMIENTFYTDENKVSERVERLNTIFNDGYWYKTLTKVTP
jgi:hypothetical protein